MTTGIITFGIVGAGGSKASGFDIGIGHHDSAAVHAVCDTDSETLETAAEHFGVDEAYLDYEKFLEESGVDAVILATPQHVHGPQAVSALNRDIHVLSEVPAGDTLTQCRDLVRAANGTDALYMLGENYTYYRSNLIVRELVDQGVFGDVYYAEGSYIHPWRKLMMETWRNTYRVGIEDPGPDYTEPVNGLTYPTHPLGPVVQWLGDDRIDRISCEGSGQRYADELDGYEMDDSITLTGKTERDGLVRIRLDMISNRPKNRPLGQYELQGTGGCYMSGYGSDPHKIWLEDVHGTDWRETSRGIRHPDREFGSLEELADEYLPERYSTHPEQAGHGGGDYYEVIDFIDAIAAGRTIPIDIHDAMEMTLPGIMSRKSIANDGEWTEVPDSQDW